MVDQFKAIKYEAKSDTSSTQGCLSFRWIISETSIMSKTWKFWHDIGLGGALFLCVLTAFL